MQQTIRMKAQEFSILYLGKDKHARTIISQRSYGKQRKNIVVKWSMLISIHVLCHVKKKASYETERGTGSFNTNMYFFQRTEKSCLGA